MGALSTRCFRLASVCVLALAALPACADEIRLKDGKKLYGVIVAYEENMFRVKTDFGYVLVEKDKIAPIIPRAPASSEAQPASKSGADSPQSAPRPQSKAETAVASAADASPSTSNVSTKAITPSAAKQNKPDKAAGKITDTAVKPGLLASAPTGDPAAPALKGSPAANTTLPSAAAQ